MKPCITPEVVSTWFERMAEEEDHTSTLITCECGCKYHGRQHCPECSYPAGDDDPDD